MLPGTFALDAQVDVFDARGGVGGEIDGKIIQDPAVFQQQSTHCHPPEGFPW